MKTFNFESVNMFANSIEFGGVKIFVDGFSNKRDIKNTLPILYEEQPATWLLLKEQISTITKNNPVALDVGTGSGIWAALIKKNFPKFNVIAIDKNQKVIKKAEKNFMLNNLDISTKTTYYNLDNFLLESADIIVLTPPYHLYPKKIENYIPLFARGGNDGQTEFKNQMLIAEKHLKKKGKILFNMMCLGNEHPNYCNYLPYFFSRPICINYYNIFPKIQTKNFLEGVYGTKYEKFQNKLAQQYRYLFYTCGFIKFNEVNEVKEMKHNLVLNRDWNDRITLHREINEFRK